MACFELIYAIVNFGKGSKVMREAKKSGVSGGTIILAKGTAKGVIADFLGLSDIRKEMCLWDPDKMTAGRSRLLIKSLSLKRPAMG